jgi:hypothetical protein
LLHQFSPGRMIGRNIILSLESIVIVFTACNTCFYTCAFCPSSPFYDHVRWGPLSPRHGASSGCGRRRLPGKGKGKVVPVLD